MCVATAKATPSSPSGETSYSPRRSRSVPCDDRPSRRRPRAAQPGSRRRQLSRAQPATIIPTAQPWSTMHRQPSSVQAGGTRERHGSRRAPAMLATSSGAPAGRHHIARGVSRGFASRRHHGQPHRSPSGATSYSPRREPRVREAMTVVSQPLPSEPQRGDTASAPALAGVALPGLEENGGDDASPFPALTRRAVRCRPVRGWKHAMPWPPPPFPALTRRAIRCRPIRGWKHAMPWPAPPFPALTRRALRYRPVRGWKHAMPWPAPPFPALTRRALRCRPIRGWKHAMPWPLRRSRR